MPEPSKSTDKLVLVTDMVKSITNTCNSVKTIKITWELVESSMQPLCVPIVTIEGVVFKD